MTSDSTANIGLPASWHKITKKQSLAVFTHSDRKKWILCGWQSPTDQALIRHRPNEILGEWIKFPVLHVHVQRTQETLFTQSSWKTNSPPKQQGLFYLSQAECN